MGKTIDRNQNSASESRNLGVVTGRSIQGKTYPDVSFDFRLDGKYSVSLSKNSNYKSKVSELKDLKGYKSERAGSSIPLAVKNLK